MRTLTDLLEELWGYPDNSADEQNRACPDSPKEEEIRLWYSWLFEGTRAGLVLPLWESAYTGAGLTLLNDVTLEVVRCYCAEQLIPCLPGIPADDVRIELEFFLYLIGRQKQETAASFYQKHLRELARHVFAGILKYSGCAYYTRLAQEGNSLLEELDGCMEDPGRLLHYAAPAGQPFPDRSSISQSAGRTPSLRHAGAEEIRDFLQPRTLYTSGRGNCGGKCELEVETAGGCVPDLHAVKSRAPLTVPPCARGRAYRSTYLCPGRLRYPMLRVGERGEGVFRRISWAEALDLMHRKITDLTVRYGPGCRYVNYSSGVCSQLSGDFVLRRMLGQAGGYLGNFNSYSSACVTYTMPYVYGTIRTGSSLSTFRDTNLAIFWGNNPLVTEYCDAWLDLLKALKAGGTRTICIDPHYHETAKMLHSEWIPIRPDTDAALAAAIAYVLWEEKLCDQAFMDQYCLGFDAAHMPRGREHEESYRDYIFGVRDGIAKDPEWAAAITGVKAQQIRDLARAFAGARPGAILAGRGCQRTAGGEQNVRSITLLSCMMGYVGQQGGGTGYNYFLPQHKAPACPFGENPYQGRIPSFLWTDAILDGKHMTRKEHHIMGREQLDSDIKILFNLAGNCMLNQHSDSNRTACILKDTSKCEFIVVSDLFMTPSARYADLLLPGTSMFEDAGISKPWGQGDYLLYAQQAITPLFESRFEVDWILELEKMLGADGTSEGFADTAHWYRGMYERIREEEPELPDYETFCQNGGCRFRNNREHLAFAQEIQDPANHPFPTESGKIEIYSSRLADMEDAQIPAIPKYIGGFEGVTDARRSKFPLQLIGWHTRRRTHSVGDPNPELEKLEPHRLWIHPQDAAVRGLAEGDPAEVFNDRGVIRITAHLSEDIMPGVICIPQGAWFTPDETGTDIRGCVNTLTTSQPTALAKANPQHSCLVQVRSCRR